MSEMFRLRIKSHFDAAHQLLNYDGKCANLHGHTWEVEVFITGQKLQNGMIADFSILKKDLERVLDTLDHTFLNDITEIGNPTAENICKYIFQMLDLPKVVTLEKVRVWETSNNWCEYYA